MNMHNTNRLLISEPPLQVLPSLATKLGLSEAVALQQIHYWLQLHERADKQSTHFHEGRWWVYNTYENWQQDNFPFWSVSGIKKIFTTLQRQGVLIKGCFNANKADRTQWVSIDYDNLDRLSHGQVSDHSTQSIRPLDPPGPTIVPTGSDDLYTEITPETTPETNLEKRRFFENSKPKPKDST